MPCRSWVAVELLCFCEEAGLQQEAVALCTYLAGRDEPADTPTSPSDPLVEATLKRCKIRAFYVALRPS